MPAAEVVQLNVRLPRELKEQGDATLALVGSSPAKIIRQVWTRLAEGGKAYERLVDALADSEGSNQGDEPFPAIERATKLFENMAAHVGLDVSTFEPSGLSDHEILEQTDWERLVERGLA